MLELTIPLKPVAKGRPKIAVRNGFAMAYTPAKTVRAEKDLRYHIMDQYKGVPLECPLWVALVFQLQRPKSVSQKKRPFVTTKPDIDNYIKTVMDAGNQVIWRDDSLIVQLIAEKCYGDYDLTTIRVEVLP